MSKQTLAQIVDDQDQTVQWVEAAMRGDRAAMGRLYQRYEGMVTAVGLRRLRDVQEAQELCQDVFIQAIEKLDQLQRPECFAGWLRSIAVRMSINRALRVGRRMVCDTAALDSIDSRDVAPLDGVLCFERHRRLKAGLARLRPSDRSTLEAFYVRGQSLADMSRATGAPVGTIKRRLHVARKRLAAQVADLASV
jgi:RNA polymerase sigma-70 factor (ECF subfamily)